MPEYTEYYVLKPGGSPMGPLTVDIIEELAKQGEHTADYLYAESGAEKWAPLAELGILAHASFPPADLSEVPHVKPSSRLVWCVVLTFIGCLPLGVYSIFKSQKVAEFYAAGRYAEAKRTSDSVRNLCLLNVVIAITFWVLMQYLSGRM